MVIPRKKRVIPDGLWIKCEACNGLIYRKAMVERSYVCPVCDYHFRIPARERIRITLDEGSFQELWPNMEPTDPLNFKDRISYSERVRMEQERTGLKDAVLVGTGAIHSRKIVFGVTDSNFIMGSMGSVVGEKISRAATTAQEMKVPVVIISGSGGGARMHEGMFSLMQMAKTSAAISRLKEAGGVFISVLTDPTMGGVMASYASLGDIILAEPGALIGFAGPRVIEQTIKKTLPEGFQTSEFLLEHGFLDMIVSRQDMRRELARLIDFMVGPPSGLPINIETTPTITTLGEEISEKNKNGIMED
ncbi:MAG TPA: acetyl-CoA carboxylase, carboxyltransferase subunit beta [Candidatus Hypogeohydataceae bacterium YC41]